MPASPTIPAQDSHTGYSDMPNNQDSQLEIEWRANMVNNMEKLSGLVQQVTTAVASLTTRVEAVERSPREMRSWLNTLFSGSGCLTMIIAAAISFVMGILSIAGNIMVALLPHIILR